MLKYIRGFFIFCLFACMIGTIQFITNNPFKTKKTNELNIFVYSDFLDVDMIDSFEQETGIKVNLHFFISNEELLAKLKITNNKGYDLLFLADYAGKILAEKGDLQEIDKSRIAILDRIYPFLLNKDFDPGNIFSIPYVWECSGFAYDPNIVKENDLTLKHLFDSPYRKVMTGDPIESINFAASYLYGDKDHLTTDEEQEIASLLKKQKKTVEAYAEFRAKDLMVAGDASFALLKTPHLDSLKEENNSIAFALPKDYIYTSIENVVLCKQAENVDNAYLFLNYIFKPENLAMTVDRFPCFPACPDALEFSDDHHESYLQSIEEIKCRKEDLRFFYYITEKDTAHKIFVQTKA
ncbi:MAG: hypothetical protein SP4CHLAM5_01320 [Chlamydiia bacterium]|nr:hypothetical protein [Chlamydiia bacterium]MCH9618008.1 hypothetical protein [Chlamydiia bacterium]MCH9623667.1 hypothetical protein [Chlamydiia bacterium]